MRPIVLVALLLGLLLPAGASAATYESPGGDVELRLNGQSVELVRDGAVVASDALTVRNPDGGILRAHVTFDGGDGDGVDALNVVGGMSDSASSTATGADSGRIVHRKGLDELVVAYDGLEPTTDLVASTDLTITYGNTDDAITIDNGTAPAD